jgi:hypothetical protein
MELTLYTQVNLALDAVWGGGMFVWGQSASGS